MSSEINDTGDQCQRDSDTLHSTEYMAPDGSVHHVPCPVHFPGDFEDRIEHLNEEHPRKDGQKVWPVS